MKIMKTMLAALAGFVCIFTGTSAQTMELSFDRAVDMIAQESQDLKKASANINRATAGLDAANANRWFTLDGTATYMNMINIRHPGDPMTVVIPANIANLSPIPLPPELNIPDTLFMAGVTLTQPLYTFGKIGNAVDAARSAVNMASHGQEVTARAVRYAAAELYWSTRMSGEMVTIARESLANSRDAERLLTSAGRANRVNLIKIAADIASKEVALSNAEFNHDAALRTLKIMAGIDAADDVILISDIPSEFSALKAPEKLESNPEWDLYESQAHMYEQSAKSRRAAARPTLAATASYNYVAMGNDYNPWRGADNDNQSAYWGLALTVPLWDGGAARAHATLDAMDAAAVRADLDKSKKLKTNEYNTAIARHKYLLGNLTSLKTAYDLAEKTYDLAQARFAAGQTSAVELADVDSARTQMRLALLDARVQILMAAENVKKIGTGDE